MDLKLGIYRHYKNKDYRVIQIAKDHETLEDMVVYETLYINPVSKYFVRPLKEFTEMIEINGVKQPRYKFIKEN